MSLVWGQTTIGYGIETVCLLEAKQEAKSCWILTGRRGVLTTKVGLSGQLSRKCRFHNCDLVIMKSNIDKRHQA